MRMRRKRGARQSSTRCTEFQITKIRKVNDDNICHYDQQGQTCVAKLVLNVEFFNPEPSHTAHTFEWKTTDGIIHDSHTEQIVEIWVTSSEATHDVAVEVTVSDGVTTSTMKETFQTHHLFEVAP